LYSNKVIDEEKIHQAFTDIEKLKIQLGIAMGQIDSEKGTVDRSAKRIYDRISEIDRKFHEILYDPKTGLVLQVDRLTQESTERRRMKNHIIAIWIAVGSLAISFVLKLVNIK